MPPSRESLVVTHPEIAHLFDESVRRLPVEHVESLLRQRLAIESADSFSRAFRKVRSGARQITRVVPKTFPAVGAQMALAKRALPALGTLAKGAAPLLPVAGQIAGGVIGGPAGAM